MRPTLDRALEVCAIALMGDVAPNLPQGYRQASVLSAAVLLSCVREELDRVAERRITENRVLRELFRDAAPVVDDPELEARLAEAAVGGEAGYRISELEASNGALRRLLVELHARVEELSGEAARRIESRIWEELRASTERRRLSLGAF